MRRQLQQDKGRDSVLLQLRNILFSILSLIVKSCTLLLQLLGLIKLRRYAYMETLKKLKWGKVAALTQDGQKYSDYISELQVHYISILYFLKVYLSKV
jgi:hypothetical protein